MYCCCSVILSYVWLSATLWPVACQPPLSVEFSRQEYWSVWPFLTPGDLPNPGIKPTSSASAALACMVLSHFSCVQLSVILWTVARQAPLFMGFSRQEYWSVLPGPPPGDLPYLGIEPSNPHLIALALAGWFFSTVPHGKPLCEITYAFISANMFKILKFWEINIWNLKHLSLWFIMLLSFMIGIYLHPILPLILNIYWNKNNHNPKQWIGSTQEMLFK